MCSHGLYRLVCKAGGTPEANLDVSLGDLGRAPALSLLGVGADRPKWCPAESKMFRHADKALAGSFHGIRVVPARIVSPGAVQVGASSLRSLRRISSHSMRRSLQNGSYGSYYLLGPALSTIRSSCEARTHTPRGSRGWQRWRHQRKEQMLEKL